jgi:hypothetical protein
MNVSEILKRGQASQPCHKVHARSFLLVLWVNLASHVRHL